MPRRNGSASANSYCRRNGYSSAQADTCSTPAATSALTNPHANSFADANANASLTHAYSHGNIDASSITDTYSNGHTGTASSSAGDLRRQ